MSQQINLYDAALLRKPELLTAASLAAGSALLLAAVGGWGAWARSQTEALEAESRALTPRVKVLKEQKAIFEKAIAEAKPSPALAAELASAQALLALRGEIVAALKKGMGAESVGFAEYLRGLARQTTGGLWLTGFSVADNGAAMEIRGRMTDPALLPEYIRRLNGEKAFKGRSFATLTVSGGQAAAPGSPAATAAAPASAPFHEFKLSPAGAPAAADGRAPVAENPPQRLASTPLADADGTAPGGKR